MAESEVHGVKVEVIHAWSAPSSPSTSLMYSFAQRDDVEVLDEPVYANFLRVSGLDRPYRVLGLTEDLMKKGKHFILIRNPLDILPSFDKVVPPSFFELRLAELVRIYNELCELGNHHLLLMLQIFDKILSWEAGPKPIDGLWAPWCYKTVHKSTGFKQEKRYPQPFPFSLYDLMEQSLPLYNMLRHHMKEKTSLLSPPLPPPDLPVPANEKLLAWVGDEIVTRESAKVSMFDSIVQGGDSVWEGLRVYKMERYLSLRNI